MNSVFCNAAFVRSSTLDIVQVSTMNSKNTAFFLYSARNARLKPGIAAPAVYITVVWTNKTTPLSLRMEVLACLCTWGSLACSWSSSRLCCSSSCCFCCSSRAFCSWTLGRTLHYSCANQGSGPPNPHYDSEPVGIFSFSLQEFDLTSVS